ncbi:acyl-CoA dehydrogenase family protein [Streptomyces sp. NPDC005732]|uniref:acyl-CoA dehydrogenase family protein n=1 Tax=unclassified Streptomyces TaxID=2593676 RepID=UPI0033BFF4E5
MMRWSEEQQELREAIGAVASKAGADHLERDRAGTFDRDGWQRLRDVGLFGLPFDPLHGGLGKDLLTTVHVLEQLGHDCQDSGLNFSVSTHMVSTGVPLQRFGSSALKARYLPEICAGTMIGAHAITEPSGGSDVMGMQTTAVLDGDDYVLNGSKSFISNASIADVIVVYARTGAPGDLAGITAFLVRRDSPGLSVGNPISKMGLRTSPLAEVFLDDVRVPRDHVVGSKGAGFLIFDHVMKWEILCGFGINVGEMRRRLERCVEYARTRTQFGSVIGANQSVANMIVEMRIDLETSQKWIYDTAEKVQSKADAASDVAMTKLVVSEANVRSALNAIQVFGGYGYVSEYGVEKDLRDAVGGRIYSGTSEIQRQRLATLMGLNRPLRPAQA